MNFKTLIASQNSFFLTNATKSIGFRKAQLKKLKQLLLDNEAKLHEAIFKDFKKSDHETNLTELFPVHHEIDIALRKLGRWSKKKRVGTNLLNFPAKSYIVKEPLGVTLVIGAWNYPYVLSLTPLVASIAAGNTVILKPSEIAFHTSKLMTDLINSNFDANYVCVVEGGIPETTALLHERFDKIFFTGSPQVGKIVYQAAAKHLTPVTLELGGKNPAIFHDDASLTIGVKRMVWSKFLNAGQICMSPDYILVHDSIKEAFLKAVVAEIEKYAFSIEKGNYVQIINDRNFQRLTKLIDKDKVYYGGNYNETERYIAPTIMHNVTLEDAVMQEEIFGPILPVITYKTLDEAIAFVHGFEKPLSAYIYTKSNQVKKRLLNEISFGGGCVNESIMHFTNDNLPFGGVGNSGFGSYHGKFGFDTFSHEKAILDKPPLFELNLKYYNYTKSKMKLIKKLFFSKLKLS